MQHPVTAAAPLPAGRGFLIAATSSNCGKTTFTMGLLRALRRRGLKVQPYKCGPDYIDPMFHRQASGQESVNLDCVMASEAHVREIYARYAQGADLCVVEGVMGLYDGRDRWHGSSAEIAMLLGLPVILLVNAKSTAYSIAPLLYGYRSFVPSPSSSGTPAAPLNLMGVVFNMVGSPRHYAMLRQACEDAGVECLGYMGRNGRLQIPSRHLGLSIAEMEKLETLIEAAADEVAEHVDIDRICAY